jgi:hypothetical protein
VEVTDVATSTTKWIRVGGKVLGTIGIVAGLAFGFAYYGQQQGFVKKADADIVTSTFAPKTKQQRFVDSLKEYGFAEPRMYDWDGNDVFFTSKTTRKSPSMAAREMQEIFERRGVNEKAYMSVPKMVLPESAKDDPKPEHFYKIMDPYRQMHDGDIVPFRWGKNQVAMGGVEMEGDPRPDEILRAVVEDKVIFEGMKRLRYVEAFRAPGDDKTTMTATWSDGNLDFKKFGGGKGTTVDSVVPACPGCERMRRFGGTGDESGYVENLYKTNKSPKQMLDFYQEALEKRGWKKSKATKLIEGMERLGHKEDDGVQFDAYARGRIFLHVVSYRDAETGQTRVHIMRGP